MKQKGLATWLKVIIIGVALCGLIVYFHILPSIGQSFVDGDESLSVLYWPWLLFLWGTAIPCYTALVFAWKVAVNIGKDRSFSIENANSLKWISWLAVVDVTYFFVGNIVLFFLQLNHPGVMLYSLLVVFAGLAVAVAAAVLSRLVRKAAELQEQSDLTI